MPFFLRHRYPYNYYAGFVVSGGAPSVSGTTVNQRAYALPFVVQNTQVRITRLGIDRSSGGASSLLRFGVCDDAGGLPGSLLVDGGTVSGATGGAPAVTLSGTGLFLGPGVYWVVMVQQGGSSPTLLGTSSWLLSELPSACPGWYQASVSGALPSTWTGTSQIDTWVPGIFYEVSGLQLISVGTVFESDQAGAFTPIFTPFVPGTVTQAVETDTAGTITPRVQQRITVGQATETETAREVTPGAKVRDLSTSGSSATSATYTTGVFTPAANSLILALFQSSPGGPSPTPAVPVPSATGLSFTNEGTALEPSGAHRTTLFSALAGPTPTANNSIAIGFGGQTQVRGFWSIIEITGVAQTGTIVQAATNTGASISNLTVTLAAFANANNLAVGAFGLVNYRTLTQGAGFTKVGNFGLSGFGTILTEYKPNDTTVDMSSSAPATITGIAVEVKVA